MGANLVVPVAMESVSPDSQSIHLFVCDFEAFGILVSIQTAVDLQAFLSSSRTDQVDNNLVRLKWNATPVACDVAKQTVLDFIPFACSRWVMANFDRHARFVGKLLQFVLPKPIAMPVAASTVGSD